MNIFAAFDGMSCGQISINRLGIKDYTYYASEVDKFAIKVTKQNYPNTIHVGDIRHVDSEDFRNVDLLMGGSPCQNLSFAGKQKGMVTKDLVEILDLETYLGLKEKGFEFEGQSYLFWEFVRLLKECKPKYFLLENVNMSKKWRDLFSKVLGCEPIKINSKSVIPQSRTRLYWTNIPQDGIIDEKNIKLKDVLDFDEKYKLNESYQSRLKVFDKPKGIVYGTTKREGTIGQRDECFSVEGVCGCLTATMYKQPPQYIYNEEVYKLSPIECERLQTVPEGYTSCVSDTQRYKMLGNGWTVDVISHLIKGIVEVK